MHTDAWQNTCIVQIVNPYPWSQVSGEDNGRNSNSGGRINHLRPRNVHFRIFEHVGMQYYTTIVCYIIIIILHSYVIMVLFMRMCVLKIFLWAFYSFEYYVCKPSICETTVEGSYWSGNNGHLPQAWSIHETSDVLCEAQLWLCLSIPQLWRESTNLGARPCRTYVCVNNEKTWLCSVMFGLAYDWVCGPVTSGITLIGTDYGLVNLYTTFIENRENWLTLRPQRQRVSYKNTRPKKNQFTHINVDI